jgi:hypothetical protein
MPATLVALSHWARSRPVHFWTGCWLLILGTWTGGQRAWAQIVGEIETIDQISIVYEENLAKLNTWVAELRVIDKGENTELSRSDESLAEVSLAYDRTIPAHLIRWRCKQWSSVSYDGKRDGGPQGSETGELVRAGNAYRLPLYEPHKDANDQGPLIVTGLAAASRPTSDYGRRLVPLELFWYRHSPVPDRLRGMVTIVRNAPDAYRLEIVRNGSEVSLTATSRNAKEQMVFDLQKGGLCLSGSYQSSSGTDSQRMDVVQVNGVWVPSRIVRKQIKERRAKEADAAPQRPTVLEREIVWTANLVNVPIPEEQFTVDALRAGRPATLSDAKTLAVTRVGPSGEELPGRRGGAAAGQAKPGARWGVGFLAAVGLPLALLAYYGWRRLRRQ